MDLQEKRKVIEENHEAFFAALNSYLDRVYDLTDKYFEEDGSTLKKGLSKDDKLKGFITSTRKDAIKFEKVRKKIHDKDFELSLSEINYAGLALVFVIQSWSNQIENLTKAKEEANIIVKKIFEKESS